MTKRVKTILSSRNPAFYKKAGFRQLFPLRAKELDQIGNRPRRPSPALYADGIQSYNLFNKINLVYHNNHKFKSLEAGAARREIAAEPEGRAPIWFFLLVILFLIIVPLILLYSQGYRFDFERKKITQTGAFYFKVLPKNAEVYLNGKLNKKTDFFFGTAFIDNLLPKKYEVEIKKEGYFPWKKTLEIREKQVTEAKNVILFPKNLSFNILTQGVEDFFFSPDESKIILETKIPHLDQKLSWALKIFDLEKNVQSHLMEEKDILNFIGDKKISQLNLLDLEFSPDSKKFLMKIEIKKDKLSELKYFLSDLENPLPSLILLDFLGKDIKNISFHPQDSKRIFFTKLINREIKKEEKIPPKISLFEADYERKKISQLNFSNLVTYTLSQENIFWLSEEGYLFKNQEKINREPLSFHREIESQIYLKEPLIFLKTNGFLYLLDQDSKIFTKIDERIKNLRFSPDAKKIVYFSNHEIWLLFLEKSWDQPPKEKGEKLLIGRFSEEIGEVFWLSSHYLIFNTGNQIKIGEIDERDRINIFDVTPTKNLMPEEIEFKDPKIYWNQTNKKLYLLSQENLYNSEKLVK